MNPAEIRLVVDAVSNEKSVPKEIVFQALEAALATATKKHYGATWEFRVAIDRHSGNYETFRTWQIVDDSAFEVTEENPEGFNPDAQILIEDALLKDPKAKVGDKVEEPVESIEFGRIAAQVAKQVIMQWLRAAKREQVADEYRAKVGELIAGIVKK